MKSKAALFWVLSVVVASIVLFVYLMKQEAPRAEAKLDLSYFADEQHLTQEIVNQIRNEIQQEQFFWIGVEPEKPEQLLVAIQLANEIQKLQNVKKVVVDKELEIPEAFLKQLNAPESVYLKENIHEVGKILSDLEKNKFSYILITASIYSTSFLKKNPIDVVKAESPINPMTISFSYFPTTLEDEKNMLFTCQTEDRTGTSDWACQVVNIARGARRRIEKSNAKPWVMMMNLANQKDYVLLLKKK